MRVAGDQMTIEIDNEDDLALITDWVIDHTKYDMACTVFHAAMRVMGRLKGRKMKHILLTMILIAASNGCTSVTADRPALISLHLEILPWTFGAKEKEKEKDSKQEPIKEGSTNKNEPVKLDKERGDIILLE
jgi:hypothetical protein